MKEMKGHFDYYLLRIAELTEDENSSVKLELGHGVYSGGRKNGWEIAVTYPNPEKESGKLWHKLVTLSDAEAKKLRDVLNSLDLE